MRACRQEDYICRNCMNIAAVIHVWPIYSYMYIAIYMYAIVTAVWANLYFSLFAAHFTVGHDGQSACFEIGQSVYTCSYRPAHVLNCQFS